MFWAALRWHCWFGSRESVGSIVSVNLSLRALDRFHCRSSHAANAAHWFLATYSRDTLPTQLLTWTSDSLRIVIFGASVSGELKSPPQTSVTGFLRRRRRPGLKRWHLQRLVRYSFAAIVVSASVQLGLLRDGDLLSSCFSSLVSR